MHGDTLPGCYPAILQLEDFSTAGLPKNGFFRVSAHELQEFHAHLASLKREEEKEAMCVELAQILGLMRRPFRLETKADSAPAVGIDVPVFQIGTFAPIVQPASVIQFGPLGCRKRLLRFRGAGRVLRSQFQQREQLV